MRRILLDFVSSLILSAIGFLLIGYIYQALDLRYDIGFGGDKGNALIGLFLGLPCGAILGILVVEKLLYKTKGWNVWGIFLAVLLSFISNCLGIIMLDKIGGSAAIFILLLVVITCLFGYRIVLFLK